MHNKILNSIKENKEIIMYLIVGVITTLVNYLGYFIFTRYFHIEYITSNFIAWLLTIIVAYILNKVFVFNSQAHSLREVLNEVMTFTISRIASLIIETIIIYVGVSIFMFNDNLIKITSTIIVVVLNYVFSKIFVFNNNFRRSK